MHSTETDRTLISTGTCSNCGCGECIEYQNVPGRFFQPDEGSNAFREILFLQGIALCPWNCHEATQPVPQSAQEATALLNLQIAELGKQFILFGLPTLEVQLRENYANGNDPEIEYASNLPTVIAPTKLLEDVDFESPVHPMTELLNSGEQNIQALEIWLKGLTTAFPCITKYMHDPITNRVTLTTTDACSYLMPEVTLHIITDPYQMPESFSPTKDELLLCLTGDSERTFLNGQLVVQLLIINKCHVLNHWFEKLEKIGLSEEAISDFYYNIEDLHDLIYYFVGPQFNPRHLELAAQKP